MSFNLIDAAKGLFTPELSGLAGTFFGENENGVSKAISGMIPAVLLGLTDRAATTDGAQSIANLAQDQFQSGILNNLGGFLNSNSGMMEKGAALVSQLFGQRSNSLIGSIASFAGLKSSSTSGLMSMAVPAILALIGRHTGNNSGSTIADLFSGQKEGFLKALPQGLQLGNLFPDAKPAHIHHQPHHEEKKEGMGILFPLIVLALLGAAAWYLFGNKGGSEHPVAAHTESHATVTETTTTTTVVKGKVDSLGNYIYDLGALSSLELPNGIGKFDVGTYSTEARLVAFLNDKSAVLDTVKGNWFEFTNVQFNTASAVVSESSMDQLKHLVMISKAFPAATFKIGGYTDNTGNAAANVTLSQQRADAVLDALKKLGAAEGVFTGAKGYGPEYPIADNATAEGRAQNRRVAVNVKSK